MLLTHAERVNTCEEVAPGRLAGLRIACSRTGLRDADGPG